MSKRTLTEDTHLFQQLAGISGYRVADESEKTRFITRISGMFDFGIAEPKIDFLVTRDQAGFQSYFCQIDHQALSTGLKDKITPTWSVSLVALEQSIDFDMLCFYKKLNYGKLRIFKAFSPAWTESEDLGQGDLKNFTVMTTNLQKCEAFFTPVLASKFADLQKSFKSGLLPKCITLQVQKNCIAVYGEFFNFEKPSDYLRCYEFATACRKSLLTIPSYAGIK